MLEIPEGKAITKIVEFVKGSGLSPGEIQNLEFTEDFLYLMGKSPPGPLICVSRGKLVLMAAGHHACVINFGLEANIIGMTPEVYYEIVSEDFPGPNPDTSKSESISNFHIPKEFIWVWGINDFTGLVRMHVTSRQKPWDGSDFEIGGSGWHLFNHFKGGPDWYLESWCQDVLVEYETLKKAKHSTFQIDSYFIIIHEICTNKSEAFAGFGRHTANDFLYLATMFPGTPAHIICQDSKHYEKFKDLIYTYQSQFSDPELHRLVSTSPNINNPFAFNENSNTLYMERYVKVFWCTTSLCSQHAL
ncbi:hypothetical protein BYT27DRAFT_7222717 [Phlegmacium glaucopus]|nr:hypothetical protein BYT27DRAFT_7222717 [Phlegmacium glaucopus]